MWKHNSQISNYHPIGPIGPIGVTWQWTIEATPGGFSTAMIVHSRGWLED